MAGHHERAGALRRAPRGRGGRRAQDRCGGMVTVDVFLKSLNRSSID
jgi:hypothetical protein